MRTRKKRHFCLRAFILSALILFLFCAVSVHMRHAASDLFKYRAGLIASEIMADSVRKNLENVRNTVLISTDRNGEVLSVQADIRELNRIQAEVLADISEAVSSIPEQALSVSAGTLFAGEWLSGLGPKIIFRLSPSGRVRAHTYSRFTDAGVNQTCHRIILALETSLGTMTSFGPLSVRVPAEFTLAETIIVGEVPESYTHLITGAELLPQIMEEESAFHGYSAENHLPVLDTES